MSRKEGSTKPALLHSVLPVSSILTVLTIFFAATLMTPPLKAANPGSTWAALHKQAEELLREGRSADAERALEAAIRAARLRGHTSADLATALNTLGTSYHDSGRLVDAERAYKESLSLWGRFPGPSPVMGVALGNLAGVRLAQGRPSDAEKLYRQAERVLVPGFGAESWEVAHVLCGLTAVYWETGRHEEAKQYGKRALAVLETAGRDPELGVALFLMAKIAWKENREAEAERLLRRAIEVWRRSLGTENANYASGLTSLAVLLSKKDSAEADRLFREALELAETRLGPNHAFTGFALGLYAGHLRAMGNKSEAKKLKRRGEAILAAHSRENRLDYTLDVKAFQQRNAK